MTRRALSMWQPWATLCVAPLERTGTPPKRHETRAFAPRGPFPLDVVIHATKKWDSDNAWTGLDEDFVNALCGCGFLGGPTTRLGIFADPNLKPLPFGAIIGIATIAAVEPTHDLFADPSKAITGYDYTFGDWNPGRYAWRFENAILLPEPIPFKGRQDVLYLLDNATQALVDEQLRRVA